MSETPLERVPAEASETVLVVLVLYRLTAEESPAFCSLRTVLEEQPELCGRMRCRVYDNSPEAHPAPAVPFACRYFHDPRNPGLAVPYQLALEEATATGTPWLLLLDQDTVLTGDYLRQVFETTLRLQNEAAVVALVPKLMERGSVLSPHWPLVRRPLGQFPVEGSGVVREKVHVYNSGAVLRVRSLAAIGGFPQSFPLDYLDHAVFHQLQAKGGRIYVLPAVLQHELSTFQTEVQRSPSQGRRRSISLAENRYYWTYGTARERFAHTYRRLRRVLGLLTRGEVGEAATLMRLTLSRS